MNVKQFTVYADRREAKHMQGLNELLLTITPREHSDSHVPFVWQVLPFGPEENNTHCLSFNINCQFALFSDDKNWESHDGVSPEYKSGVYFNFTEASHWECNPLYGRIQDNAVLINNSTSEQKFVLGSTNFEIFEPMLCLSSLQSHSGLAISTSLKLSVYFISGGKQFDLTEPANMETPLFEIETAKIHDNFALRFLKTNGKPRVVQEDDFKLPTSLPFSEFGVNRLSLWRNLKLAILKLRRPAPTVTRPTIEIPISPPSPSRPKFTTDNWSPPEKDFGRTNEFTGPATTSATPGDISPRANDEDHLSLSELAHSPPHFALGEFSPPVKFDQQPDSPITASTPPNSPPHFVQSDFSPPLKFDQLPDIPSPSTLESDT